MLAPTEGLGGAALVGGVLQSIHYLKQTYERVSLVIELQNTAV
jgi:hypothetical protein